MRNRLCAAFLLLLCLLLFVCAPGLLIAGGAFARGRELPSPLSQGLPVVAAPDLARAWRTSPRHPWFVTGLPPAPGLSDWPSWGASTVRVLASPTGVFGAYGDCELDAAQDDDEQQATGVSFRSEHCRRDARCRPVHFTTTMSILAATQAFLRPSSIGGASHVYLRGVASDEIRGLAEERVGLPLSNLALYLSAAGSVTNLHWDSASGVLAQSRGEKDVALFAASSMPQEAGRSSPCFRRSYLSGSAAPQGSAFLLRLTPGWGLFVPALWAHHVSSRSPETLGTVWRFPK